MSESPLARARELLALAWATLDRDIYVVDRRRSRAAALLGRRALEELIAVIPLGDDVDLGSANMRSKLICLRELSTEPAVTAAATVAWAGLSNACHHHAYELTPTVAEVRRLLDEVSTVEKHAQRAAVFNVVR